MGNSDLVSPQAISAILSFAKNSTILLGVSGGRDSMALLHALHLSFPEKLIAIHVNHGLRSEAAEEQLFVRTQCKIWNIPFIACISNVSREQTASKQSLETAARKTRYRWMSYWLNRLNSNTLILAHHADDQTETVLFNLMRGSAGLQGMSFETRGHENFPPNSRIFRPLLEINRQKINQYLIDNSIPWRDDPSNFSPDTGIRNTLRLEIIPKLNELMGRDITKKITQSLEISKTKQFALNEAISLLKPLDPQQRIHLPKIKTFPASLQKEIIAWTLKTVWKLPELNTLHIQKVHEMLLNPEIHVLDFPCGWRIRRRQGRIFAEKI